jgi:hypothetical protein
VASRCLELHPAIVNLCVLTLARPTADCSRTTLQPFMSSPVDTKPGDVKKKHHYGHHYNGSGSGSGTMAGGSGGQQNKKPKLEGQSVRSASCSSGSMDAIVYQKHGSRC